MSLSLGGVVSWRQLRRSYGEWLMTVSPYPELPVLLLLLSSVAYLSIVPGSLAALCLLTSSFPLHLSLPLCYLSSILATVLNFFLVRLVLRPLAAVAPCLRPSPSKLTRCVSYLPVTTTILLRLPYLGIASTSTKLAWTPIHPAPLFFANCIGLLPGCLLWSMVAWQVGALGDWVATLGVGGRVGMVLLLSCALMAVVSALTWLVKWRLRVVMRAEVIRRRRSEAAARRQQKRSSQRAERFLSAVVEL